MKGHSIQEREGRRLRGLRPTRITERTTMRMGVDLREEALRVAALWPLGWKHSC